VPSTFRQPDDLPMDPFILSLPVGGIGLSRFAFRGVARGDKDLGPSLIFAKVIENRILSRSTPARANDIFVRNEPHTLPGVVVIGFPSSKTVTPQEALDKVSKTLAEPVTDTEFQSAKAAVRSGWAVRDPISFWLDADTYQISNTNTDAVVPDSVTLSDVRAYAQRVTTQPIAGVFINTATKSE
jgi:hypothetical protein